MNRRLLLGSPLPTEAESHQRLIKVQGLAVFSSDALSSVAYATEEIPAPVRVARAARRAGIAIAMDVGRCGQPLHVGSPATQSSLI
jgi:hypothetical protein